MIKGLQLDYRYAGIFLTRSTDTVYSIKNILEDCDVSVWLYESPEMILCIIIGDKHTESVISSFQKVHEIVDGSSMIAGILANRRLQPRMSDNYFFRIPLDKVNSRTLIRYIHKNKLFCLFLPHSNDLCILTDGNNGLELLNQFKNIMPLTGFVLKSIIKKPKRNNAKSKSYDPIGAQIGEILNRFPVALKNLIQETEISWKKILHTEPPSAIKNMDALINTKINEIKSYIGYLHDTEKDIYVKKALLRQIDNTLFSFKEIARSYANFKDQLRDYKTPINPWDYSTSYLELSTPLVLNAAKRYVEELKERAGISNEYEIIPIFSEDFAAYPLIHPSLIPGENRITRIISLPRETKLRLGAFPILGHAVGHFIFDKNHNIIVNEIIADLAEEKCALSFNGAFDDLDKIWKFDKLQTPTLLRELEDRAEQFNIFRNRLSEIICDLIAAALVGPAYVYALPRFAMGTLSQFCDRDKHHKTHPSIAARVVLCIELLNALGFMPTFVSQYLEVTENKMNKYFVSKILSLIKEPYSYNQHSNIGEIQKSLANGVIISNRPTIIINALWDAVIHKRNYINEIAALSSLLTE